MCKGDNILDCKEVTAPMPVGVDGAVGVSGLKWFVAIVNSRHEKSVAEKLKTLNIESYVATQSEMRLWRNGRRKMIDRVVIPSVVFVRCSERQRREIVSLPYINRFMVNRGAEPHGLNRPVAVISDSEIDKLRFMLGQTERPVEFVPTLLKQHDTIRVIRGSLMGLEGTVLNNPDGSHSLLVSLAMLGGAKVSISPSEVEKYANGFKT